MIVRTAKCDVCGYAQEEGVPLPQDGRQVYLARLRYPQGSPIAQVHLCTPCVEKERERLKESVFGTPLEIGLGESLPPQERVSGETVDPLDDLGTRETRPCSTRR